MIFFTNFKTKHRYVLKRNINPNSKELEKTQLLLFPTPTPAPNRCKLSIAKIPASVAFEKMFPFASHIFRDNCHCFSVAQSCSTLCNPCTEACQASLSFTISQKLLKLMSIESLMPSNHLILCRPLFLLPSIFPSIRVFANEPALHIRWPKYWSFNFSISPSNKYSGLISFRIN